MAGSDGYIPTLFPGADKIKGKKQVQFRVSRTSKQAGTVELQSPLKHAVKRPAATTPSPGRPAKPPKPANANLEMSRAVWATTDHDYVKTKTELSCPTETEALKSQMEELRAEVEKLKERTLGYSTIKDFPKWTNLPNREVFDALVSYLKSRGGEDLKYWKGSKTDNHQHFRDAGLINKPGPERKLSFEEELFLVLVKLKTGLTDGELEQLFGTSATTIGRIHNLHEFPKHRIKTAVRAA